VEEAWPYSYAGLHDIASEYYQRAIAIDPGFGLGHYNLGMSHENAGRYSEALACYRRAMECMGSAAWVLASVATASIALNDAGTATHILATLDELGRSGVAVGLSMAMVFDALDRPDRAIDALERSIDTHEPFVWAMGLEGWLRFPRARRLPRFQSILKRLGTQPHDIARQRALLLAQRERDLAG
jgi:tetratricopeptide (TPR) repeat protein